MKQQFTKAKNRKSASGSSNYNHDKNHRDHKGRTEIMEDLTYKTEALKEFGWETIDKWEDQHQKSKDKNNHAKELMESLPNEWYHDKKLLKDWTEKSVDKLAKDLGVNKEDMFVEVIFHYNYADKHGNILPESKRNLHAHFLISERTLNREIEQERYTRNSWYDNDKKRTVFQEPKNGFLLHQKGELKFDKNGEPVYKEKPFTPKMEFMKTRMFLQNWKEGQRDLKHELDPNLNLQVGKDPTKIPMITYNRAEERLHPERVDIIKEINQDRREINKEHREAIQNGYQTKEQVIEEVSFYLQETKVRTEEKTPDKLDYFSAIRDFTKDTLKSVRDFIKEKGRELAEKVKEKINSFIDNSPLQQEPIYLYSWELGHDLGIRGRGAIKYDKGVLTIINSDHDLKQFQADFKSKEELIEILSANGVSQINDLKNTSNEREYMNLFSQLEQSREIERERDLER